MTQLLPARGLAAALLFAGIAASQQATMDVSQHLSVGSSAQISYENPAMAGQTVTVEISNGSRVPERLVTVLIVIELDAKGRGTGSWIVENWFSADFNAPDAAEQHRSIQ